MANTRDRIIASALSDWTSDFADRCGVDLDEIFGGEPDISPADALAELRRLRDGVTPLEGWTCYLAPALHDDFAAAVDRQLCEWAGVLEECEVAA